MANQYPLNFHYDFLTSYVINDPEFFTKKVPFMKAAGVRTVWLDNYVYGEWQNSLEDARRAKAMLEAEGFEVQAICVPLGHGSNALNGDEADPTLPETWQNRVDYNGNRQGTTTCVDDAVIAHYREAVRIHRELGFTKLFYDDDLRMGSWGPHLQGCYCDRCLDRFYKKYPQFDGMSRADIVRLGVPGSEVREAWETIQCDAVLRFLDETTPEGLTPGIMVMHNGDRRHGLDIPRIKEHFPNALFRVGEGHFDDGCFNHPACRPSIETCIKKHLSLIGSVENAFSETTTYPVGALSPENWVEKMRWEISCGLRNLYLMSGNVFLTDPYWEALIAARSELEELAAATPLPTLDGTPVEENFVWHL
ncbi:MAG: hypothetical protein IJX72_00605 [Clostridia bacterium]|nr:hypothetical protein [Clostridia bacterium]